MLPALLGRQTEVDRLLDLIRPPYTGPEIVLIEGPAGIGKTSVLRAALEQVETQGLATLRASPTEAEVSFAYATLRDLLDDRLPSLATGLSQVYLNTLRRALGYSAEDDSPSTATKATPPSTELVAIAVLTAIRTLGARAPVLLAIDDAGWVDQASRDALSYAFRRLADLPVRVVLTQRAVAEGGPLPFGLADVARPIPIERLWLEPLSVGALRSVVGAATGADLSRPTLLRIHEISAGNPFYAIELARAIEAQGEVLGPGQDLPVPMTLRDLVSDRLQGLPPSTRRVLLAAAMSSRPNVELLTARLGRDIRPLLKASVEAGLLRIDGDFVAFAHPLIASTLVAQSSEQERLDTHVWLAQAATEDFEARARHAALAHTGANADVAEQLALAAAQARQRGAPLVAAELADLAVERTPEHAPERAAGALAAADAWFAAGEFSTVQVRIAALLPSVEGVQRARALVLKGLAVWFTGITQEAVEILMQALADSAADDQLTGLIHYYLSIFTDADLRSARDHALAAADMLSRTSDHGHHAAALLQVFYISVVLGLKPELALLERGLALERDGDLVDRLTSPGIWWAGIGRLDRARERFSSLLEFDRAHGMFSNVGNLLTRLAEVEVWADNWKQARKLATAALEGDREAGVEAAEMTLRALAYVDALEGDIDLAERAAKAGVERCENGGAPTLAAAWLKVFAIAAATRDDAAAVVEATARAARHLQEVGFVEPMRLDPAPERAEALAILGRESDASAELRALEKRHRLVPKPWAAAAIARTTARLAIGRGDLEGALSATDDVATSDPVGWSRFDVGRTLLVRAGALRRARSRRGAAEVLSRARTIFDALGASRWTKKADAELNRLGLTRSVPLALTPTEARVARLAGEGLSTRAVAAELGISPRTVETHLAGIYGKLGVSSRAELGRVMAGRVED